MKTTGAPRRKSPDTQDSSSKLGTPLHLLIISNTEKGTHIQGADRDWVNLLNALGPDCVRVSWAGIRDTERLGTYLNEKLITRFIDLNFSPFYELFHESMYRHRTLRQWIFIILRVAKGLWRPLRRLRQEMQNDPPDVVITNTSVVLVGAIFSVLSRRPHVWCVKEFLDPQLPVCRRYAWLIEKLSDVVIVPSKATGSAFSQRVRVLHDGNDLRAIQSSAARSSREAVLQSLGLPPAQLVIVQTGVLCEAKGQHVTARACLQLASEGHDACSIIFLGAGSAKAQDQLRGILNNAPREWRTSIRFIEFEPGDFSYISAADIVVHPSILPDPYPNAIREALILGKPIVGSRLGGIPELVEDQLTGILVEPDESVSLASALKSLIVSSQTRAQMGEAARKFAEASLDIRICKQAFLDTLLAVVKR